MTEGRSYSDSYEAAVGLVRNEREKMEAMVKSMNPIAIPDSPDRDAGAVDPDEK
jgi:hypothetical protein